MTRRQRIRDALNYVTVDEPFDEIATRIEAALGPDDRDAWKADAERLAVALDQVLDSNVSHVEMVGIIQRVRAAHDALVARTEEGNG